MMVLLARKVVGAVSDRKPPVASLIRSRDICSASCFCIGLTAIGATDLMTRLATDSLARRRMSLTLLSARRPVIRRLMAS